MDEVRNARVQRNPVPALPSFTPTSQTFYGLESEDNESDETRKSDMESETTDMTATDMITNNSDDDSVQEIPPPAATRPAATTRKRRVIDSDDEDEENDHSEDSDDTAIRPPQSHASRRQRLNGQRARRNFNSGRSPGRSSTPPQFPLPNMRRGGGWGNGRGQNVSVQVPRRGRPQAMRVH